MNSNNNVSPALIRFGGISGIVTIIFIPAIILQQTTGWFPDYDFQPGTMEKWLENLSVNPSLSLAGIGLFIVAIIAFFGVALTLYRAHPKNDWFSTAALAAHILGITLALTAFLFAYGFTWGIADLLKAQSYESKDLIISATMGMRGFLASDDIATCLIGIGNGLAGLAWLKTGKLPKWLCWWGVVAGALVTIVLLMYFIPVFAFAAIGYPLVVLWFFLTGIVLLRKTDKIVD